MESIIISSFSVLNTDYTTRLPVIPTRVPRRIFHISLSHGVVRMANTHDHELDHLPILFGLQTTATSSPARHRTYIKFKKDNRTRYRQEVERKLNSCHLPTDCRKDEILLRATLLKTASHHIPTGMRKLYT